MQDFQLNYSVKNKASLRPNPWDILALSIVFALFAALAWGARQMAAPYHFGETIPISLDPHNLPAYALQTVLRMFIALFFSFLFTFIFGTWAAKSKRAERIIIPLIDVLQSVPVLGFLMIAIVPLMILFPNSLVGPEIAAIFAIFTSQAWNMILSLYQTVSTVPTDLIEAAKAYRLSAWQQFWRIEVPYSMPGLLWNAMISMSAGWFFVVFSEAISVANQNITLPGIGSYVEMAIVKMNVPAIFYAILTMLIVILLYDQLIFRPLISWSDKFRSTDTPSDEETTSWVLDILQRTRLLRYWSKFVSLAFNGLVNLSTFRKHHTNFSGSRRRKMRSKLGFVWDILFALTVVATLLISIDYIYSFISLDEVTHVFILGAYTATRVVVLVIIASIIWIPVGVWIGKHPKIAAIAQPIVQILAAFPANLFFPLVVILIVKYKLNVNIWTSPLMILGSQWYILFNVVAGASLIPKEFYHVASNLGVRGRQWWQKIVLPGIYGYFITGAIAAAGAAWNASIVAEIVTWGNTRLQAQGIGAYITEYTALGDFPRTALGIGVMCLYILVFNRFVWRPLYNLAQNKFRVDA